MIKQIDLVRTAKTLDNLHKTQLMVSDAFNVRSNLDNLQDECERLYHTQEGDTDGVLDDVRDYILFRDTDDKAFDGLNQQQRRKAYAFAQYRMARADAIDVFSELAGEDAEAFRMKFADSRLHEELYEKCDDEVIEARNEYEEL